MKYIRTKGGRIFYAREKEIVDTDELKWEAIPKDCKDYFTLNYKDEEIISKADTIEELCDEFVIVGTNWQQIIDLDSAKYNAGKHEKLKIYGAIWTDKGLIYVAKMNDKGELELL